MAAKERDLVNLEEIIIDGKLYKTKYYISCDGMIKNVKFELFKLMLPDLKYILKIAKAYQAEIYINAKDCKVVVEFYKFTRTIIN